MQIDLQKQTVTFKRRTFDKTFSPNDTVSFSFGPVADLNQRFILATKGEKSIVLYKVRKLENGDLMVFHAFTGSPDLLSRKKDLVILATLDQK